MKRFLAILAICSASAMAANTTKISGYISESKCGAKHNSSHPNEACVTKCISGGSQPVFVDDAKNEVWSIDDPNSVKDHYGHHVSVKATVDDANKSIHIAKVTMLPDQGK